VTTNFGKNNSGGDADTRRPQNRERLQEQKVYLGRIRAFNPRKNQETDTPFDVRSLKGIEITF